MLKSLKKLLIPLIGIILFMAPIAISVQTGGDLTLSIEPSQVHAINLHCSTTSLSCPLKEAGLDILEYIIYDTTSIFAGISALIMDFILEYSISSSTYKTGVIELGWEIVRDLVNIGFIFALLISAFQIALGIGNSGAAKSRVLKTILVALTVNFSLFMSYVIVDSSNILAHVFYNRIQVDGDAALAGPVAQNGDDGINLLQTLDYFGADKSPSIAVLSQFNPQKVITGAGQEVSENSWGQYMMVIIMAGIINALIIWIFISVSIIFLSRIVGIMLLAIAAPIAMLSILIPQIQNNKYIGFSNWIGNLFNLAFTAPIFLFFLFLTLQMVGNGGKIFALVGQEQSDPFAAFLAVIIPFSIIIGVLYVGKKVTQDMSGEIGGAIGKVAGKVAGVAVATGAVVATGGAAGIGTLTRGAGALAKNSSNSKISKLGKRAESLGSRLQSTKIDVTKIPGYNKMAGSQVSKAAGAITGKSLKGHVLSGRKKVNEIKSSSFNQTSLEADRKLYEETIKAEEARKSDTKKGYEKYEDWKEKMDGVREESQIKAEQEKAKEDLKKKLKENDGTKDLRDSEEKAYNAMIDNTEAVKDEEKVLKGIEDEIKNLNAQLNSAKGSGNPTGDIQKNIEAEKIKLMARKQGVEISTDDAKNFISSSGSLKDAKDTLSQKGFGESTATAIGGGAAELDEEQTRKSKYEFERSRTQKAEKEILAKEFKNREEEILKRENVSSASDLKNEKNKQEHKRLRKIYKQKQSELLTDSEKKNKDNKKDK